MNVKELINKITQEVYSNNFPPDFYVVQRMQSTYRAIEQASKDGDRSSRDSLGIEAAILKSIQSKMTPKVWVNL